MTSAIDDDDVTPFTSAEIINAADMFDRIFAKPQSSSNKRDKKTTTMKESL